MKLYKLVLISCVFCSACANVSLQVPDEVEWYFYDGKVTGYNEYKIKVENKKIFIKSASLSTTYQYIVNSYGNIRDSIIYDSIPFKIHLQYSDSLKKRYVWDTWEFKVNYTDRSRVTKLNYISRPTERLKLLSGSSPKREHRIEYILDGKEFSVRLPSDNGSSIIYNVCQYDETRFLFSVNLRIDGIKYRPIHYYYYSVLMIDLEDLSRKRFLGMKL
jgi:hypothetical protein